MLGETDQKLTQWIQSILGTISVSLEVPSTDIHEKNGVNLYLMEAVPQGVLRQVELDKIRRKHPLKISCRYLINVWAEKPDEAHNLLGKLIFAALQKPDYEVERAPLSFEAWRAFGIPPRPSFILNVPALHEFTQPELPSVESGIDFDNAPLSNLKGRIYGPRDLPLVGLRVTLPTLKASSQTDSEGRFYFPAIPTQPPIETLEVKGKRKPQPISIPIHKADHDDEGLLIRLTRNQI